MSALEATRQNPMGLTWCPKCEEETVPLRRGKCGWCDGETQPLKAPETLAQRAKLAREAQRAALAAMDAGERQPVAHVVPARNERTGPVEEAGAASGPGALDGGSGRVAATREVAAARTEVDGASNPYRLRNGGRGFVWTRAAALAAIRAWALAHNGAPPRSDDWRACGVGGVHPSASSVTRLFGSWAAGIEAAGFPRPTRGGRYVPRAEVAADPLTEGERVASASDVGSGVGGRALASESGSAASQEPPGEDAARSRVSTSPRASSHSRADEAPPRIRSDACRGGCRRRPRRGRPSWRVPHATREASDRGAATCDRRRAARGR